MRFFVCRITASLTLLPVTCCVLLLCPAVALFISLFMTHFTLFPVLCRIKFPVSSICMTILCDRDCFFHRIRVRFPIIRSHNNLVFSWFCHFQCIIAGSFCHQSSVLVPLPLIRDIGSLMLCKLSF